MAETTYEREIKLPYPSAEAARRAVAALGATPLHGRRLQEDCLLDTPDGRLRQRQSVIRVRMENGKSRLTFKGPVQPSTVKVREELETVVADGDVLMRVLGEVGLVAWFRYQKYREEFSLEDVVVAVDETPVGVFVELEGSEAGIAAVATRLGRQPGDYVLASYRTLFEAWRTRHERSDTDMLFPDA